MSEEQNSEAGNNLDSSVEESVELTTQQVEKKNSFWSFVGNNFLGVSILVTGVLISSSYLYVNSGAQKGAAKAGDLPTARATEVSVDDDPVLGKKDAPVEMIEFSDYQCPFCRAFWKASYGQLKKDYIDTGKVKLVYRDYPLAFHPMADLSAQAAECADEQGKYWEMHDKIFLEQDKLGQGTVTYTVKDLKRWAGQLGLKQSQFDQCLDSGKYKDEVAKDMNDGTASGVNGTPAFFINGRLVVGAQPYAAFKAIIEEELKKK